MFPNITQFFLLNLRIVGRESYKKDECCIQAKFWRLTKTQFKKYLQA